MPKISFGRLAAIVFFLSLVAAAAFSLQRVGEDISAGKYFAQPRDFHYEVAFLASYFFIILLVLRYGYYLAINRVQWKTLKDDFLYLLNRKYFTKTQWVINVSLFWLALIGFIYSLAISTMKGAL
jgi:hypothetical protein